MGHTQFFKLEDPISIAKLWVPQSQINGCAAGLGILWYFIVFLIE